MSLLHRLQQGLSKPPVELVYVPHSRWPAPRLLPPRPSPKVLVLDASFNPPTLAHLALANSLPQSRMKSEGKSTDDLSDYDARLLLLSVRNADKSLKPGDATYSQRIEMLKLFAQYVATQNDGQRHIGENGNVAIAVIDEPTFVGKSTILQSFLKSRSSETAGHSTYDTQLNFILGFDTLERLLQPRYYGSQEQMMTALHTFFAPFPEGDNSRVVCARRLSSSLSQAAPGNPGLELAQGFISSDRIVIFDIGEDVRGYSSSEVRETIRRLGLEATEWRKFVPSGVADYIAREKLYAEHTPP